MEEKQEFTTFFNLFYWEIWDRLDYLEKMWCDVKDVKRLSTISWDIAMWECFLLKVIFTIKDWFEQADVLKCIRDIRNKKDFNNFW